ncbi:DUF2784 domain-containing protein [Roseiconus lacunae]|uniref:DUF2784 domain-containing protein n=1 Tax=Roseiconus lacunae TaxID=2605694 RepID=UPI00308587C8|nr:DUF2784 domain-containing protein [Stieleria sp. HD01]
MIDFSFLADVTVTIHFAYVAFVVLGLPLILVGGLCRWQWIRNPWFRGLHLAMILIVVLEAWAGITCPMTTLENDFRLAAGGSSNEGSFIAAWLHDLMFFHAPPWVFTFAYSLFGAVVIATLVFIPPRLRKAPSANH